MRFISRARSVAVALAIVAGFLVGTAWAQDTTSLLSAFLVNLRASHLIPGSGGTAPAVSSCGDGALATGSTDTSGRVDSSNATACTITFGASFGANSADCIVEDITANRGNVSASSKTAFTVSNLTAGDDFLYHCIGR